MFKCCVCHKKASRRTSEEEGEDDSEREMDEDDDSTSDKEDDEDEEERVIEEELAQKFKCQIPNTREVNVTNELIRETLNEENEEDEEEGAIDEMTVEVNGAAKTPKEEINSKIVDREALKEDVAEILNCAVKIVQEIRRGERERLEKIKEEAAEETVEESIVTIADDAAIVDEQIEEEEKRDEVIQEPEKLETEVENVGDVDAMKEMQGAEFDINDEISSDTRSLEKSKTDQIEEMIIEELINDMNEEIDNVQELKEIVGMTNGSQQPFSDANSEETVNELRSNVSNDSLAGELLPLPYCEVQIIQEIKKTELYKIEDTYTRDNCYGTDEEVMKVMATQDDLSLSNAIADEATTNCMNGDILDIPPPIIPAFEETEEFEKSEENTTEQSFPTPPPIDFDIEEPEWKEQAILPPDFQEAENLATLMSRRESKPTSPGSKSLPSPPSPSSSVSEAGNETEADSKSSSDEQTAKIVPCGSSTMCTEPTIASVQDEDGDDLVFEATALEKDPEILKDIPPRPVPPVPRWLSQEEDEPDNNEGFGGMQEPPATPVARDELALRRHRFFADLLQAARSTAEHRVSFDPLGPLVYPGCEHDDREEHLEKLVNRLESVTKRLERVSTSAAVVQTQEIAVQTKSPSPERSLSLTEELPPEESSQSSSSSRESTVSGASVVEVKNMSSDAYSNLVAGPVTDYVNLSQQIGNEIYHQAQLVQKAFNLQLDFLSKAKLCTAPSQSELLSLLQPTSDQIQQIQKHREEQRRSELFNHLSAVSESIAALGWVAISPTPAPYIKEMNDAGQFYTNRVLKDWKLKDKTHVEWCKAWVKVLTDLQQFVRQYHTTGLVWGNKAAAGAPPPPPPCTMPVATAAPAVNDGRSALFAEINQGENITKNLKKVTSGIQTQKNTGLRTGPAPFKAQVVSNNSSEVKTTLPANAPIAKSPVFCRDGKKWLVEYHVGNKSLVINDAEMNNVVYIFRCQDSSVCIKGKINSVVMDSCRKSVVVVDSVVSSIEFVNCESVKMQVLGKVPTISIDKTDGCQMYLNKDTLNAELITSKSSEMNVVIPTENGDYVEYPVPEQFKTVITNKGLSTVAVDSLG